MSNNDGLIKILVEDEDGTYIPFIDPNDETVDVNELLASIAKKEVGRLDKNLDNVSDLEAILLEVIKKRAVDNRLDIKTLLSAIKTFNESVKRNLSVVQGKQASPFNVYIGANPTEQRGTPNTYEGEGSNLSITQRKRITSLMDALLTSEKKDESLDIEQEKSEKEEEENK